ncbi:Maf family protein [Salinibius halmophilus]|uniref:Maf family protein n=1 Tax=Salinibius halmophilus TaxID=1853216 RepID=UPI000E668DBD|nr:Maf family protein [Salinibius halmophilus]
MAVSLVLASQSPRRHELLKQIGVAHSQQPVDIDETPHVGELADDYVVRMAVEKARAAYKGEQVVLASDTCGVLDGEILLKPVDKQDAMAMWQRMAGRDHDILTSICVISGQGEHWRLCRSTVRFRAFDRALFERYWQTGEPHDKAGGYAIQGLGAVLVANMQGSYSSVMGLPLFETAELLQQAGVPVWQEGQ